MEEKLSVNNAWILDTETLAIAPDAAVIEICLMNVGNPKDKTFELLISPEFYTQDYLHCDFSHSPQTIDFHKALGPENSYTTAQTFGLTNYRHILDQLDNMLLWLDKESIIWCQGTDFDIPVLTNLLRWFGRFVVPWKYNNVRDARTLIKCMHPNPSKKNPNPSAHRAKADCEWTLQMLKEADAFGMLPHNFLEK